MPNIIDSRYKDIDVYILYIVVIMVIEFNLVL